MQRLYRVAPVEHKFPVLDTLYAGGLTSSRDIILQGSAQFIDLYTGALGGAEIAAYVYDKAATVAAVATNVLTGYSDLFNASGVYAIGGGVPDLATRRRRRSGDSQLSRPVRFAEFLRMYALQFGL